MFSPNTPRELAKLFGETKKIILLWSATWWHVMPIIAFTKHLPDKEYIYITAPDSLEEKMARSNHISAIIAPIERLRDTSFGAKIRYIYSFFPLFFWGIHKFSLLKKQWYYLIMSKGWPGSVPLSLAGKILWMQLAIHESDTVPGKANRFLGKIADIILLWYDDASKYFPGMNALVIGQILDPVWYKHDEISSNITWKTNLRHILVICGSQGSRAIFEELSHTIGSIDAEFKIILGTLNQDMKALFDQYSHVEAIDWIESQDLLCILQDTDLVVTRWSATTLAELSTSSAHFIIIPLPDAMNNHQYYNAFYYERLGHTVLLQSDISLLSQKIKSTLLLLWKHKK